MFHYLTVLKKEKKDKKNPNIMTNAEKFRIFYLIIVIENVIKDSIMLQLKEKAN